MTRLAPLLLPALACTLLGAACVRDTRVATAPLPVAARPAPTPDQAKSILRVRGAEIVDGTGRPVILRGVAFGNQVWANERIPRMHHGEQDFARVASLGMNVVRFYLNYLTLESDSEPGKYLDDGFRWLDENVAWARKNGVYLVFNLHVPPGGYQSLGGGTALWTDPALQQRFIAWWRALAAHFRGEPTVAGYDLLNEPGVTKSIDQWKDLASRTAKAIREVDPEHMIFVERVNSVAKDWREGAARNFFRVDDPNVVYEFHFYEPIDFTHQGAEWLDFAAEDQRYPDPSVAEVPWFLLDARAHAEGPKLPAGDSPWTFYPGPVFTVSDPAIVVGKPVITVAGLGGGRAFFDELVLEQVDAQGTPLKTLWKRHLNSRRGWFFWRADDSGSLSVTASGRGHDGAIEVTGTRGWANLGADSLRFRPEQGASYRLSGWMRGENLPTDAVGRLEIEFSASKVPVQARDKAFLKQELSAYLGWGKQQNVPLFLGEWGAIRASFEGDRGGIRWTSDMLDLLLENRVSFTWHAYHEHSFGLFDDDGTLPRVEDANAPLLDLFRARLGGAQGERAGTAPPATASPPIQFIEDDYPRALSEARAKGVPLLVDAWASWCHTCLSMRAFVFPDERLRALSNRFVWTSLDVDREANAAAVEKLGVHVLPTLYVVDPADERVRLAWPGSLTAPELEALLTTSLEGGGPPGPLAIDAALARTSRKEHPMECVALARAEAPRMPMGTARADVVRYGIECAHDARAQPEARAALGELAALGETIAGDASDPILADDRSDLYAYVVDAYDAVDRKSDARRVAAAWTLFLERQAADAPTPSARAVFDAHRLEAYLALGEPGRALPMLAQSEHDFPDDYNPPARLASALLAAHRADEALAACDRALARAYGPRKLRIWSVRADILLAKHDVAGARAALRAALDDARHMPLPAGYGAQVTAIEQRLAKLR